VYKANDIAQLMPRHRRLGEGRYVAQCPVHMGSDDNLYITDGDKGTLLYCHSACAKRDILEAIGLSWKDLFLTSKSKPPYNPSDDVTTMLIYRAHIKQDARPVTRKDAIVVNSAQARLHRHGYKLTKEGILERVKSI